MLYDLTTEIDRKKAEIRLKTLIKREKIVEITEKRRKRSNNQNAYLHAMFGVYGAELGYTIEEAKTIIKRECGLKYEKNGILFLRRTSELDTAEMTIFISKFRTFAAHQGLYLHTPEEYEQGGWVEVQKTLQRNQEYL